MICVILKRSDSSLDTDTIILTIRVSETNRIRTFAIIDTWKIP